MAQMSVYYGERICEKHTAKGIACGNKAYYVSDKQYVCGVHSRSDKQRQELPTNPNAKQVKKDIAIERNELVESAAKLNRKENKHGKVICTKLRMMKDPEYVEGFLKVFPNYKHQHRSDGFGCASLSPKSMGPIDHKQPGLPVAKNLENLHQGNKCFPSELDSEGKPGSSFYETRKKMYLDDVPHRHKKEAAGKNAPVFSIWIDLAGKERRFTYFQSRQFYCTFYERIAKELDDYKYLKNKIVEGYNIQIIGYDAYEITKSVREHYMDTSKPFGHELVLYTMLTTNESDYPWREFKTEDF
jgi:hypothetical protein